MPAPHTDTFRSCLKRKRSFAKSVEFSVVTEFTFRVGIGAGSVPSDSVPGVGLAGSPIETITKRVRIDGPGRVMMYSRSDRLYLLQRSGEDSTQLAHESVELQRIQLSRLTHAREHLELKREKAVMATQSRNQMHMQRLLC
ncbi:hypothetical protein DYB37_000091 [Aphanomyces astaci]|uniref:Uncharacterized protein n=1 Tax=Aphanomyces astaci TaxID=112090 RepID=A0A397BW79_APHAT|nr:hypothetical protein DYB25_007346 [Aphanomyces astaci]RHY66208.1 hypothetical protein DYB34_007035 [Aphanomyces astaci]RHY83308.1 hypothetical protein DYB35_006805 [Aphanomyces astaci]RHY99198.1 hypothetical protein DYB31_009976 [Aphanomyces astaci]RHZ34519.1 hypothetical protein DYB37_000091 [Aphanomyces astaci]